MLVLKDYTKEPKLNTAFATELFDLIEASNVDYWIFGHSHEVVPDFKIGKTTLTTNQLGYVEYGDTKISVTIGYSNSEEADEKEICSKAFIFENRQRSLWENS